MSKLPFVYIMASKPGGVLYVGVTSNLPQRVWQHKNNMVEGFTQKYAVHDLVYFEEHSSMDAAITREKQIKHWKRAWKIKLIRGDNPKWEDLYSKILM